MPLDQYRAVRAALGPQTASNLVQHARAELHHAGLYDADADYDGMIGHAIETLIRVLAAQGHSGASIAHVMDLTVRLVRFESLNQSL